MAAAEPGEVREVGIEWSLRQTEELINRGAPAVHFYVMQNSAAIKQLMETLLG